VKDRSGTARLSSVVGGLLMVLFGAFVTKTGFELLFPSPTAGGEAFVNEGMIIVATGLLIAIGSEILARLPEQRRGWGAFVIVLALVGWVQAAAFAFGEGLPNLLLAASVGPVLAIFGGVLAIQSPSTD